jgi:hypothetical protein
MKANVGCDTHCNRYYYDCPFLTIDRFDFYPLPARPVLFRTSPPVGLEWGAPEVWWNLSRKLKAAIIFVKGAYIRLYRRKGRFKYVSRRTAFQLLRPLYFSNGFRRIP